jgi:chemotaxis protein CheD
MHRAVNERFNLPWVILHPGDYYATANNELVSTVLGSCIALVLVDPIQKVSGMNHFMLPTLRDTRHFYQEEAGRYGMYAMDLLINDMMKLGALRTNFVAKIFGGGRVLTTTEKGPARLFSSRGGENRHTDLQGFDYEKTGKTVAESNIQFALEYLKTEKIKIHSHDLGGSTGRKIFLFTHSGKVLQKRLSGSSLIQNVAIEESQYLKTISKRIAGEKEGTVTLFDKK